MRNFFLYFSFLILSLQSVLAKCTINGKEVPCDEFWALVGPFFIVGLILLIGAIAFWVWMMVHCVKRDAGDRIAWVLVVLLAGIIGAIIYFFVIYLRKK